MPLAFRARSKRGRAGAEKYSLDALVEGAAGEEAEAAQRAKRAAHANAALAASRAAAADDDGDSDDEALGVAGDETAMARARRGASRHRAPFVCAGFGLRARSSLTA